MIVYDRQVNLERVSTLKVKEYFDHVAMIKRIQEKEDDGPPSLLHQCLR